MDRETKEKIIDAFLKYIEDKKEPNNIEVAGMNFIQKILAL